MKNSKFAFAAATTAIVAAFAVAAPAEAGMTVDYYKVMANGRDFQPANPPISTISDGVKTVLGPNGLPMITSANPLNAQDYNTATNELQWWTPTATSALNVSYSGSQTLATNSISSNAFYAPFGNGSNDANGFLTAVFSGMFTLNSARSINFSLGSDDDAFLFVDGISRVQIGGIHPVDVVTTTLNLSAGTHSFKLFYADRLQSNAAINFSLPDDVTVSAVPEPATWALMLVGFAMVGAAVRYRRRSAKVTFT